MAGAEPPRLDQRPQLGVPPLVRQPDPQARGRRQRDALEEHALVALEQEVAGAQVALGAQLRLDGAHVRVDLDVAERARHGHAVVAVRHEVELADPVHVDRRHRLAAPARGRDPLPATAQRGGRGPELAVELVGPAVDGADDRVQRDRLHAEVALAAAAERGHDLLERQHDPHVVGLLAEPRDDAGQRAAPPLAAEAALGVLVGESGAHPAPMVADPPAAVSRRARRTGTARTRARRRRRAAAGRRAPRCRGRAGRRARRRSRGARAAGSR